MFVRTARVRFNHGSKICTPKPPQSNRRACAAREGLTGNVKRIGTISEYRIDCGPGYRIDFGRDGEALVVLLGGGSKKTQQRDIPRAEGMWSEYKHRKKAR